MEKWFNHNEFEDYLKEKAEQYKMYPSDKVWKGIDKSLRSYRKWYWTGFILLLSSISYVAITELIAPSSKKTTKHTNSVIAADSASAIAQLNPFTYNDLNGKLNSSETVTSDIIMEDSGSITASFDIPLQLFDVANLTGLKTRKASLLITGLEPLNENEKYNIELIWPDQIYESLDAEKTVEGRTLGLANVAEKKDKINWLQDQVNIKIPALVKRLSWQLTFSPTVNYRKLSSSDNDKNIQDQPNNPVSRNNQDVNNVVNHRPARGFEIGSHALLNLNKRLTFKGGLQFNYSKYDIEAFRAPRQSAVIALDASLLGTGPRTLTSYTDINTFDGTSAKSLKNQYFQLSVPVGLEYKVFGGDKLQFRVAGTVQPTYLLNKNTYLITTDYKNYTQAPSLVRRWNVNTAAEAFISYDRGGVRWQIGPQFRYQLLSTYESEYPIKEYLMEYGIKVGVTKTIR